MNSRTDQSMVVPTRFNEAVQRLDGDAGLLREMAYMTLPDFPILIENAAEATAAGDCEASVRVLHKLKGMLSTFESEGIVMEIQEMITAARANKPDLLASLFAKHRPAVEELVEAIRHFAAA